MKINTPINQSNKLVCMNNIGLTLAEQIIFENLSFQLNRGDKVALLGDSGVGKSTLLKLIAGIHQPSKGTLTNQASRIGYVFQEPRLLPWLTVAQNITEVMKPLKINKEKREHKLTALLTQVDLLQYKNYYPYQLSGGMAQRVSLARAFAIEPDLLLLDEPFSALDRNLTQQLSQLLSCFLKPEITMLYVSHYIDQVLPLVPSRLFFQKNKHGCTKLTVDKNTNIAERENFLDKFYSTKK
ncbi:ABC transporter ATP-binding protein [Colwellia sp. E150_009]